MLPRSFAAAASVLPAAVSAPRLCTVQPPPVLDVAAVPHLDAAGRTASARWLTYTLPRAFAVAPKGVFGSAQGVTPDATAKRVGAAVSASCVTRGGSGCALYVQDLDVV